MALMGSGGFVVCSDMRELLDKPGILSMLNEHRLRVLYQRNSMQFSPALLNPFANHCYRGNLEEVMKAVESGTAPDLTGRETGYEHGYAAFPLFGAQRFFYQSSGTPDHIGTLKYLLKHGAPPNVPDIIGYTPLHHACMAGPRADMVRILLEHGANPDAQDRFGSIAIVGAFQNEAIEAIEVLMEFGARLDIPEAGGHTPDGFFIKCGPKVTAVVQKWKRRRAGAAQPLDDKACATQCAKSGGPLKFCAKCHATWYCSRECQKEDWKTHKHTCVPFSPENTVVVTPYYEDLGPLVSVPDLARKILCHSYEKRPERNSRSAQVPRIPCGQTKQMIIKVQVPTDSRPTDPRAGDLLVYDKKRTFVCRIRKRDCSDAYMRLSEIIRTKGAMGLKRYFSAEMRSPDALTIKVSEVLAEQAF